MSGVDDWSQAERDLYALGSRQLLDNLDRQIEEWRESWALDTSAHDDMIREHNARMRALEEHHKAWLARHLKGLNGEADEPVPSHELAGAVDASVSLGHRPQQPTFDPRAAELAEAERIRAMPMSQWAEERQRLIRPNQGMF